MIMMPTAEADHLCSSHRTQTSGTQQADGADGARTTRTCGPGPSRVAARQEIPVPAQHSAGRIVGTNGDIGEHAALGLMQHMVEAGRHLRMPNSAADAD